MYSRTVSISIWLAASVLLCLEHGGQRVRANPDNQLAPMDEFLCYGGDYRYKPDQLQQLQNCTVIEGHLKIMFYRKEAAAAVAKLSFPRLREITGFLLLYRVYGLRSLGRLFPNLAVIRGRELFYDYALVAYEMHELEELGLQNLMMIARGSVRLEKNPELCYVETVDWRRIQGAAADDNFFLQNKMVDECHVCASKCNRLYSNQLMPRHCWNGESDGCQKSCSDDCDAKHGCRIDDRTKCCDYQCMGGCYGPGPNQCVSCKNVLHEGLCQDRCPDGTFKYHDRRCLTADECMSLTVYQVQMKPFQGECLTECPRAKGFKEDKTDKSKCIPCEGPCPKICSGIQIDSVATAQRLKGCTIIKSYIHIQIKKGHNIVQELEENLSMIEEIEGYVKITRSAQLVSLSFFKNLRLIKGNTHARDKYSFYVVDNRNLQDIWNMTTHPKLKIEKGSIYFDLNRRLCLDKIYALADQVGQPNPPEQLVSTLTNGDEGSCDVGRIAARVVSVASEYALLHWDKFIMKDDRYLMGYVISYREAEFRNISIFGERDACGNDVWNIEDYPLDENLKNASKYVTLLSELKPWTQYVVYIQTYTVAVSKKSGRSELMYFKTQPDVPTHPRSVIVDGSVPGELLIRWKPPSEPKGNVTHYHVYWYAPRLSRAKIDKRDYCTDRIQTYGGKAKPKATVKEEPKKEKKEDNCHCKQETRKETMEDNTISFQIEFENYLQNYVYRKRPTNTGRRTTKVAANSTKISDLNITRSAGTPVIGPTLPPTTTTKSPLTVAEESLDGHPPFEDMLPGRNDTGGRNETEDDDDDSPQYSVAVVYNKREIVLPNLRHFQTYNIEVMACQEYDQVVGRKLCSNRAIISATTQPSQTADDINPSSIRTEHAKRDEVVIYWDEPEEPNGLIVTYELLIAPAGSDIKKSSTCLPHKHYQEFGYYRTDPLSPGNFSFQIRATSLAGVGQWTSPRYFQILEPPIELGHLTVSHISVIALASLFVIAMVLAIPMAYVYYTKQRDLRRMPNVTYSSVNPEYMSYEYTPDEWEVEREKIVLGDWLGEGSFGNVYQGVFSSDKDPLKVAVKTLKPDSSEFEKRNFLREATVMKAFDCFHVVRLLGVVSKGQPALVLMELMRNGDLKKFLRERRPDYADPGVVPPTTAQVWRMASEIADGMAYLESKKYVHRDLAARNCMVAEDLTVKIGDFGMTRDVYETDYYKKGGKDLLPVRWMAPESLRDGVFTSASDVWSYGVVLWEIGTLACQPYQGHSNEQVLKIVVNHGYMEKPEGCPQKLYELMLWCWNYLAKSRPRFGEIIDYLVKEKCLNYEKFYHVSYFLTQRAQEAKEANTDDVIVIDEERNGSAGQSDQDVGHASPSHRAPPAGTVTDRTSNNQKEQRKDSSDSSRNNCKPSAIKKSCSGDSSQGSVKSNGSAHTNGLANGHAHRPVHC